jgi:hypothetical protein
MRELVGVTDLPFSVMSQVAPIKGHLLLFDHLVYAGFANACRIVHPDVGALEERGVMSQRVVSVKAPPGASQEWLEALHDREDLIAAIESGSPSPELAETALDLTVRLLSCQLREVEKLNALPLTPKWTHVPGKNVARADVIQLVIKDLPVPGESHSFDDILAFRDEARSAGLTQSLRVWINEMASGKLSDVAVSDKLEDLVSRYERTLKLEKMSRTTGVVETLVCTTAEIAESLVKFQWSKVAKKLFDVRHKQIDLMKAEMTLPGREVAYIVKARERFKE